MKVQFWVDFTATPEQTVKNRINQRTEVNRRCLWTRPLLEQCPPPELNQGIWGRKWIEDRAQRIGTMSQSSACEECHFRNPDPVATAKLTVQDVHWWRQLHASSERFLTGEHIEEPFFLFIWARRPFFRHKAPRTRPHVQTNTVIWENS